MVPRLRPGEREYVWRFLSTPTRSKPNRCITSRKTSGTSLSTFELEGPLAAPSRRMCRRSPDRKPDSFKDASPLSASFPFRLKSNCDCCRSRATSSLIASLSAWTVSERSPETLRVFLPLLTLSLSILAAAAPHPRVVRAGLVVTGSRQAPQDSSPAAEVSFLSSAISYERV